MSNESATEPALVPASHLVITGACSPNCMLAVGEDRGCRCVCGGRFHGALADIEVDAAESVRGVHQAAAPRTPSQTFWLCRRCGADVRRGYVLQGGPNMACVDCMDGKSGHWLAAPDCPISWHDKHDHPERFIYVANRRVALAAFRSAWYEDE